MAICAEHTQWARSSSIQQTHEHKNVQVQTCTSISCKCVNVHMCQNQSADELPTHPHIHANHTLFTRFHTHLDRAEHKQNTLIHSHADTSSARPAHPTKAVCRPDVGPHRPLLCARVSPTPQQVRLQREAQARTVACP